MKLVSKGTSTLCRVIIAAVFWLAIRLRMSVTIRGVELDKGLPRTYIGMMHRRDIDPLLLVPALLFRHGWRGPARDLSFALRGDGFSRGFLARVLKRPAWLARLLRPLALGALLRWLGAYPTDGLLRPAEEWLREARQTAGHVTADTVLAPAFLDRFARLIHRPVEQVRGQDLEHLLSWDKAKALRAFCGPEILRGPERRPVERRMIARIHAQIADLVDYLWHDGSLLGAPEGQLSPDGHVGALHSGFQRIVRAAPPDLRILPVSLSYDFMTRGRTRAFVTFAPALLHAPKRPIDELADELRRSWLLHMSFTCTQLASGFVWERRAAACPEFTLAELASAIHRQARELADAGRAVDPLLLRLSSATRRARSYLAYAERHGLVRRLGRARWLPSCGHQEIKTGPREVAYNDVPLLYAYNELQDLLSVSCV